MPSVNQVILIGNLGSDPEVYQSKSGNGVITTLNLATSRKTKDQSGEWVTETEWHRICIYGRHAEIARDYLKKGSLAYIEGRIRSRKYTDKEGIERRATEIICDRLQLLDRKELPEEQASSPSSSTSRTQHGEDIPF